MYEALNALASDIEAAHGKIGTDEAERIVAALRELKPDLGIGPADLSSVEAILHAADAIVPGWTIQLSGKATEPDGHWTCVLRRSAGRDDDEFIGRGSGPAPGCAILGAVLRTVAYQQRGA